MKKSDEVVEVVRCKDCKEWLLSDQVTHWGKCHSKQWDNDSFYYDTFENDFCSYGERRCDK